MRKKEIRNQDKITEDSGTPKPRRAKLIKKKVLETSTRDVSDDQASPHLVSGGGIDRHLDAPTSTVEARVALRAYEHFLERGGQHGQDLDDWLEAERQVRSEDTSRSS